MSQYYWSNEAGTFLRHTINPDGSWCNTNMANYQPYEEVVKQENKRFEEMKKIDQENKKKALELRERQVKALEAIANALMYAPDGPKGQETIENLKKSVNGPHPTERGWTLVAEGIPVKDYKVGPYDYTWKHEDGRIFETTIRDYFNNEVFIEKRKDACWTCES